MSRPWLRTHFIEHDMSFKNDDAVLKDPVGHFNNGMVKQLTSARTFLNRDGLFVSCLAWRGNSVWAVSSSGRLQVCIFIVFLQVESPSNREARTVLIDCFCSFNLAGV